MSHCQSVTKPAVRLQVTGMMSGVSGISGMVRKILVCLFLVMIRYV